MLATGLIATLSRAGLASFALGLVVLALLLGVRLVWRAAPTLVGAAIAAAALVPGIDASSPAKPLWAGLGLIGGLLVGTVRFSRVFRAKGPDGRQRRRLRLGLLGVVLGGAMAGAALLAAGHSSPWANRLSVASPDRGSLASVALHMWRTHLLSGVGPDHEVFIWMTPTHQELFDRYAHDEYLQLAVEEGAVGLLGLVALAAGVAAAVRRGRRFDTRRDADLNALRAGALAGLVCFALQSGFDFLWHVPVVPMIAAVAVGLAVALPPPDEISQPKQQQEVPCSDKDG
jgi:O-antigen ligase